MLQTVDHGQRQLPLPQVGTERLADGVFLAGQVEEIVGDLEGEAEVPAVVCEPLGNGLGRPRVQRPEPTAALGQCSRLPLDDREVVGLGQVEVPALADLAQFARMPLRRMTSDQLFASIVQATGFREQRRRSRAGVLTDATSAAVEFRNRFADQSVPRTEACVISSG